MQKTLSYRDVKGEYNSTWEIPYPVLLELKEWKDLRMRILERDKNTCTMCKKKGAEKYNCNYFRELTLEESIDSQQTAVVDLLGTGDPGLTIMMQTPKKVAEPTDDPVILHVHHLYYVHGDAPWEYPDDVYTTLCHDCHWDVHQSLVIPTYTDETKKVRIPLNPCKRCFGTGFMPQYYYCQSGICFRCNGRKFEEFIGK